MTVAPDGRIEPNSNREGSESEQTMNKHSEAVCDEASVADSGAVFKCVLAPYHPADHESKERVRWPRVKPGGSGAGSTVEDMQAFGRWWLSPAMRASLPLSQQGGAAAAWRERQKDIAQLRADLAAAQAEIERLKHDREWSRDTHAIRCDAALELADARATIERQNAVLHLARVAEKAAEDSEDDGEDEATLDAWYAFHRALAALDRATTEATTSQHASSSPQKAPSRVPAPNHDHTDTENADGPHGAVADGAS